jgi:hypothetical protein
VYAEENDLVSPMQKALGDMVFTWGKITVTVTSLSVTIRIKVKLVLCSVE